LMAARRIQDRSRVQDAKVALGERGPKWWEEPSDAAVRKRLGCAMRTLLRARPATSSICPSDAARVVGGLRWRALLPVASEMARSEARAGELIITQRGKSLDPEANWRGPIPHAFFISTTNQRPEDLTVGFRDEEWFQNFRTSEDVTKSKASLTCTRNILGELTCWIGMTKLLTRLPLTRSSRKASR
jgi:hypothetical protein